MSLGMHLVLGAAGMVVVVATLIGICFSIVAFGEWLGRTAGLGEGLSMLVGGSLWFAVGGAVTGFAVWYLGVQP